MKQHLLKEIEVGTKNALLKKKIITHYIYNGSSTITDLAKELDLSVPTVTKFISEMCEEGYINDYGKLETSGGRYPSLYGLNPESGYFIGVDIKKFAINIGLINFKGDMVELKMNIPFKSENTSEALEELCKLILQFIKKVDIDNDKILNININVSGRVNPESGYSFSQFNFEERPLAEVLTEKIGFRVTIDNDTRAMTYGEYMKGCVKGEKDIIFVNVSWGLGIGIIIDGKIYTGKSGFSGEFGHTNVFDNEIICHCGKKGCLETEASGSALHRILIERIQNGESSILSNRILSKDNVLTLDEIIASVNKEDLLCIEIVEEIGQKLGKQIAGLINIFNPELVIIGGTLSLTGDYITQPIKTAVRKYSLNLGGDHDYVDVFGRHDARAVRIGGAETVREIERLARGQVFLDRRPYGDLGGVGEQILDNRRALARLLDLEQRLARDPAVGYGLVPCLGVLALADDHVEPVILQVQRLAGALHAVSDDGYRFVFEGFERFAQGEFFARDHGLDDSSEIHFCHDSLVLNPIFVFRCCFRYRLACSLSSTESRCSTTVPERVNSVSSCCCSNSERIASMSSRVPVFSTTTYCGFISMMRAFHSRTIRSTVPLSRKIFDVILYSAISCVISSSFE